jgi:hypothetical protein
MTSSTNKGALVVLPKPVDNPGAIQELLMAAGLK